MEKFKSLMKTRIGATKAILVIMISIVIILACSAGVFAYKLNKSTVIATNAELTQIIY